MAKLKLFGGTKPEEVASAESVAVIGLGRFGQSLALELMANDTEVLGIDEREEVVQELNGKLTHVVTADATQESVLRQLAVPEFDRVVVAIGTDIQSSILVTSLLLRFGVPNIWAKAVSEAHGTILKQLGVTHVFYPEKDMGKRVAHIVRGSMLDYLEIGDGFALVRTTPIASMLNAPLSEVQIRAKYGVTVTAYKRPDADWIYAEASTVLREGDAILVAGPVAKVEKFSQFR